MGLFRYTPYTGKQQCCAVQSWQLLDSAYATPSHPTELALSSGQSARAEVARCDDVEKTLRIVVTSGLVNRSRFTQGIRDSLTQPLQKVRRGARLLRVYRVSCSLTPQHKPVRANMRGCVIRHDVPVCNDAIVSVFGNPQCGSLAHACATAAQEHDAVMPASHLAVSESNWHLSPFQAGAMQPLDDFEARFAGADFHKGMEVAFSNTRSGGLALRIAGEDVRALASPTHSR